MKLKHHMYLGESFSCNSGSKENFHLEHLDFNSQGLRVGFFWYTGGSVFLTRDKVEELATTLLFWLQETDPDKED